MKLEAKIVRAILSDLSDRRGLSQEWDAIDDETRREIEHAWQRLVRDVIREEQKDG